MTAAPHAPRSAPLRWYDSTFADAGIEADFQRSEIAGVLLYSRTAIGLAAILFLSFGITDWLFVPAQAPKLTFVRMAVVAVLLGCYPVMHMPGPARRGKIPMLVAARAIGTGFVAVVALTPMPLSGLYLDCVILEIGRAHV